MVSAVLLYFPNDGSARKTLVNIDNRWYLDGKEATYLEIEQILKDAEQGLGVIKSDKNNTLLLTPESELLVRTMQWD